MKQEPKTKNGLEFEKASTNCPPTSFRKGQLNTFGAFRQIINVNGFQKMIRCVMILRGLTERTCSNSISSNAGTSANHVGESSDPRSIRHAEKRGYEMTHLARQFRNEDFSQFDEILVMDSRKDHFPKAFEIIQHS
jgi:hypothetical protein